jgi:putative transposase
MASPHRLPRVVCTGTHTHFLTICTFDRRPHFADPAMVSLARDQFLHTARLYSFAVIAYCFMPDHLHAVVEGLAPDAELRMFVRVAKQRSGFQFAQRRRQRLWQDNYFDRTLRQADPLPDVIRYIVDNPVRAALVTDSVQYPHWGSGQYTREELLDFVATADAGWTWEGTRRS